MEYFICRYCLFGDGNHNQIYALGAAGVEGRQLTIFDFAKIVSSSTFTVIKKGSEYFSSDT